MRIGLLDQTTKGWSAGESFTRIMLACLELAKNEHDTEVIFLSRSEENTIGTSFKSIFVGEYPNRTQWTESVKGAGLDVVIPVRDQTVYDVELPFVGWIPDFQHLRLPELFDEGEIHSRDQLFSAIAQKSGVILLSSESARLDFEEFLPNQVAKARVAHFPSLIWTLDRGDVSATLVKFRLPQKFALVANQFWRHKNHQILPPALGLLKRRRLEIDLVVTGLPSDYRDPENKSLSRFFQESAKEDVVGSIHFLGQIPYRDLVAMMRAAALIIQPSLFEGWSTSIEDSKALGRPLLCSDIRVHREQVPDALGFFDPMKPQMLADLLAEIYGGLRPGPDIQREEAAFAVARQRASDYGCGLLEMTKEATLATREAAVETRETALETREAMLTAREAAVEAREAIVETRLEELEPLLKETTARSEQQSKYIGELETSISNLSSELIRLRRSNHNLRRQSSVEFVSRNIRVRWRLVRKRFTPPS